MSDSQSLRTEVATDVLTAVDAADIEVAEIVKAVMMERIEIGYLEATPLEVAFIAARVKSRVHTAHSRLGWVGYSQGRNYPQDPQDDISTRRITRPRSP